MTFSASRIGTIAIVVACAVISGCAPRQAILPEKKLASIKRLWIQPFEGTGGTDVTREFLQALKAAGWTLADKIQNADAALGGTVTDYKSAQKLMVFLGDTNTLTGGKTVTVSNPVVSVNGSQVLPQGPSISMSSPHLVTERAVVGISARLLALPQGNTVWGDEFSYESLELVSARRAVIAALVRSLGRASPHLQREVPLKGAPH